MKKTFVLTLIAMLILASCKSGNEKSASGEDKQSTDTKEQVAEVKKPVPPKSEGPLRILFVGNSHTEYFVSFPEILKALVKENNKSVEVESLLEMGVSIDKILSANKGKANKLFSKEDKDGNYFDYVILQESTPVAIQKLSQYKQDCKSIYDLVSKQSPNTAVYIYELMAPLNYKDSDFKEWQTILVNNASEVAQSIPNAGVLKFATVLGSAYEGKEGYSAKKGNTDLLRHTDNSHHMLNDAVFLNSVFLYKTLFNEEPKIPQKLPLATGTGDNDNIELLEVSNTISNPEALEKIALSYK